MQWIAVILAAGFSTRMGRCKAGLSHPDSQTLLSYQIEQWQRANFWPIVILGEHNAADHGLCLPADQIVVNSDPNAGKTHSIRLGLAALPPECSVVAIAAVDQPRPSALYQELLAAHQSQENLVTVPTYNGKLGHPILFSTELLPRLHQITEETKGLRQVITEMAYHLGRVEVATPEILVDLNTPGAYQDYLRCWQQQDTSEL